MSRRIRSEGDASVRTKPSRGRARPVRSPRWELAQQKAVPKKERPVDIGGMALPRGAKVTINGTRVRVTEDGNVEVKTLFGWKPAEVSR